MPSKQPKVVTTSRGEDWKFIWKAASYEGPRRGGFDSVSVDAFYKGKLVLEWQYPRVPGHASISANATFWTEQAWMEATAAAKRDAHLVGGLTPVKSSGGG